MLITSTSNVLFLTDRSVKVKLIFFILQIFHLFLCRLNNLYSKKYRYITTVKDYLCDVRKVKKNQKVR